MITSRFPISDSQSPALCHICLDPEPLTEDASATCNQCHRPFHLRLRNDDTQGKDCGDVWIDENYLSLEFACNECLGVRPEAQAEPSVGSGH
jgi:hypothetical protein